MKNKPFFPILIFISVLAAALSPAPAVAQNNAPEKELAPILIDESGQVSYNFNLGEIYEGNKYQYIIPVINKTASALKIRGVKEDCECIKIISPVNAVVIQPNEKALIKLTLDSTGIKDYNTKYVYLYSDLPKKPIIKLQIDLFVLVQKEKVVERFESFSIGTIALAGFLDGINPCAFTVLVFFISFVTFVGYSRKQTVVLGLTFLLAVFFTYVLIGLGIFKFIQQLESFKLFSKIITFSIGALAFGLAFFNLYDYYIIKKTNDPHKTKLKLPGFIRKNIDNAIKNHVERPEGTVENIKLLALLPPVFFCGFLVSLFESVCTGQVYVPTIAYILKIPYLKNKSLLYLIFYNIVFVIPLLIVLILAVTGFSSEHFSKWVKNHIGKVKILTAILFLLLGFSLFLVK